MSTWNAPSSAGPTGRSPLVRIARRRMMLARWLHLALLVCVGAGISLGALLQMDWIGLLALLAAMLWVFLLVRSAKLVRQVREAWAAAQLGRADLAGQQAAELIESWSMLRPVTLSAVQVLAVAAHALARHAEAAELAGFVLSRRERLLVGDRTGTRLLLVDSLLAEGRLADAHAAALPLYAAKLPLADALRLLGLQLRLEARYGAWGSMCERIGAKVDMTELMPPAESAAAQALLGLAAAQQGLDDWASWLWRRVNVLADWSKLRDSEPALTAAGEGFRSAG